MRSSAFISLLLAAVVSAHSVITYPGWRGNNLITNETFPYGMQWMYPCTLEIFSFTLINEQLLNSYRRRSQPDPEPNILAHNRRCHCLSARLVPRPRDCLCIRQHGLWRRWPRRWSLKHVFWHGSRLPDSRPYQQPLPRHHLSTSSATPQ